MKKICIIGASGLAKEIYWLLQESNISSEVACFMEPDEVWQEKTIYDIPVIKQSEFNPDIHAAVLGVGSPQLRQKIVNEQLPLDTEFPIVIHKDVKISKWVELNRGTILCTGNIITCDIKIGSFSMINLDCTIGHDCNIGDYFTANPGVHVSGNCTFGSLITLGTGCVVRQGISICNDVVVGMGSVVVKNIIKPGVYFGNPAKIM